MLNLLNYNNECFIYKLGLNSFSLKRRLVMIFVTGDTHGNLDLKKLNSKLFPEGRALDKNDYVIITGNFGFPWYGNNEDKYWLKWFEDKPFTTLFVDGNHESFYLLNSCEVEEWKGGKVHKLNDSLIHLMRGQIFLIDGYKFFAFGGAQSTDKKYRKENISWWKEEMPNLAEYEEGNKNLDLNNETKEIFKV